MNRRDQELVQCWGIRRAGWGTPPPKSLHGLAGLPTLCLLSSQAKKKSQTFCRQKPPRSANMQHVPLFGYSMPYQGHWRYTHSAQCRSEPSSNGKFKWTPPNICHARSCPFISRFFVPIKVLHPKPQFKFATATTAGQNSGPEYKDICKYPTHLRCTEAPQRAE